MTLHSSTLAWKIPCTEEPGGLQSMGSLRVGQDWMTSLSLSCIGEGNGNPLQCSCLENPRDGGAWWATVYGVTQTRTELKRLSSSSSRVIQLINIRGGWEVVFYKLGWELRKENLVTPPTRGGFSSRSSPEKRTYESWNTYESIKVE